MIWRSWNPASLIPWTAVAQRQWAVYDFEHFEFLEMSLMNRENWYCLTGFVVYQMLSSSGEISASSEQWLNREVAVRSVLSRSNLRFLTVHFSESTTAYILLSEAVCPPSSPPCQFFGLVSWDRTTNSLSFSSLWNTNELRFNCRWNSSPRDTKWIAMLYQNRNRRTTGLLAEKG